MNNQTFSHYTALGGAADFGSSVAGSSDGSVIYFLGNNLFFIYLFSVLA